MPLNTCTICAHAPATLLAPAENGSLQAVCGPCFADLPSSRTVEYWTTERLDRLEALRPKQTVSTTA